MEWRSTANIRRCKRGGGAPESRRRRRLTGADRRLEPTALERIQSRPEAARDVCHDTSRGCELEQRCGQHRVPTWPWALATPMVSTPVLFSGVRTGCGLDDGPPRVCSTEVREGPTTVAGLRRPRHDNRFIDMQKSQYTNRNNDRRPADEADPRGPSQPSAPCNCGSPYRERL